MSFLRKIMTVLLVSVAPVSIFAQMNTTFEKIADDSNNGFLYKGTCTFDNIRTLPDFDFEEAGMPDTATATILRRELKDFRIVVFLGTWCEDSHYLIPLLYNALKAADYPTDSVRIYGVDREKQSLHQETEEYDIEFIPTIILMKDGKEQGRITEQVQQSIGQDLVNIIRS